MMLSRCEIGYLAVKLDHVAMVGGQSLTNQDSERKESTNAQARI